MTMPADDDRSGATRLPAFGSETSIALYAAAGFGVIAALVGLVVWDFGVSCGVFAGALIAVGNLWAFSLVGRGFLVGEGSARVVWGLLGVLKFVGLMVGVGLLLRFHIVGAIPLAVGYGALPIGITCSGLFSARSPDDPRRTAGPASRAMRRMFRRIQCRGVEH